MEIKGFAINAPDLQEIRPFIRVSNTGCGLTGCYCSGQRFISISNGKEGIAVELTEDEWNRLGLPKTKLLNEIVVS